MSLRAISQIICLLLLTFKVNAQVSTSLSFVCNQGQVTDQYLNPRYDIKFYTNAGGLDCYFRNSGVSYYYKKIKTSREIRMPSIHDEISFPATNSTEIESFRLDVEWINSNTGVLMNASKITSDYSNYYGYNFFDGLLKVRSYEEINYINLYDGIDLKYYFNGDNLKYDYVVKPNTPWQQIKFKISGAKKIYVNKKGELVIITPFGNVVEDMPLVLQGSKKLKAKWVVNNDIVSFSISGVDPKKELLIDPLVRLWATFYGGAQTKTFENCVDSLGNSYFTGYTFATNLIASTGAFQTSHGGNTDVFLAKFHRNGSKLWSTYYGSYGNDDALGVTADPFGNVIIGGTTSSTALATPGAFKNTLGGTMDVLVVKFDSTGTRLWATYFGDTAMDHSYNCASDHLGNIIVVGGTGPLPGTSMLGTPGCQQPIQGGGLDGFIVKFDPQGNRLWSTYCGGNNNDMARSVACDLENNIFVCGQTSSSVNIATPGAFQTALVEPNGFLVKYNPSGIRQWGTYFGGNVILGALGTACDRTGNVYICGGVDGANQNSSIATPGSHQPAHGGGSDDIFLAKFNSLGNLQWSTYYGSTNNDGSWHCATDSKNNVYVGGYTVDTLDALASLGAFQSSAVGISMLLVKFDSMGVRKRATYYNEISETGFGLSIDKFDEIVLSGVSYASSGAYLTTPGAYQTTGYPYLCLIVKFFDCEDDLTPQITVNNGCYNTISPSATLIPGGTGVYSYTWFPSGGNSSIASNLSTGTYTCWMDHLCGLKSQTVAVNQPTSNVSISLQSSDTLVCEGYSVIIAASYSGGQPPYSTIWSTGATGSSIVESPTVNTVYSFTVTDANLCNSTSNFLQGVESCVGIYEINSNDLLSIYPNPFSDFVVVKKWQSYSVSIFNSIGQEVLYLKDCPSILNLDSIERGAYFFQFKSINETKQFKVIKL